MSRLGHGEIRSQSVPLYDPNMYTYQHGPPSAADYHRSLYITVTSPARHTFNISQSHSDHKDLPVASRHLHIFTTHLFVCSANEKRPGTPLRVLQIAERRSTNQLGHPSHRLTCSSKIINFIHWPITTEHSTRRGDMAPYTTKASASYLYKSCTFLFEDFDLSTKFFSTPSACKTSSSWSDRAAIVNLVCAPRTSHPTGSAMGTANTRPGSVTGRVSLLSATRCDIKDVDHVSLILMKP